MPNHYDNYLPELTAGEKNDYAALIRTIETATLLEQLAEECCELGQASLKLSRKIKNENPTPAAVDELLENLNEEIADVLLLVEGLGIKSFENPDMVRNIKHYKLLRWLTRMGSKINGTGEEM